MILPHNDNEDQWKLVADMLLKNKAFLKVEEEQAKVMEGRKPMDIEDECRLNKDELEDCEESNKGSSSQDPTVNPSPMAKTAKAGGVQ